MTTTNPSEPYFEKVASQWDELRTGYFREAVRDAAIAKAHLHPQMTVSDVGAGTGFVTTGLARLVSKVHVLDGSAAMLNEARKNLAGFENLEFHQADGLALSLPDASQDAVFANMYLHHCPDPLGAIQEMVRILRPGGRLVITDMDTHTHEWLKTEMSDVWLGFEREQIRTWFQQAGLVNIIMDCTGQNCLADCNSGTNDQADISIFVASGTRHIAARDSVRERYAARAEQSNCECGSDCCAPENTTATPSRESGLISLANIGNMVWDGGYSAKEKAAIPSEAAEISLGCGNPTAMANLKAGETVLDIGSGGGIDAFLAARQVGPTGRVIGVDMTPAMLERARNAATKSGYANVEFRQGFAEELPVEDCSTDVIISNCVINLTEDKAIVFNEAYRVLRSGGRLEVNDMVLGGATLPLAHLNQQDWGACISGALPESEYLDLIRQAGFKDISVRRSTSSGTVYGVPAYSVQVSARK